MRFDPTSHGIPLKAFPGSLFLLFARGFPLRPRAFIATEDEQILKPFDFNALGETLHTHHSAPQTSQRAVLCRIEGREFFEKVQNAVSRTLS
jgi:hypothetical protein